MATHEGGRLRSKAAQFVWELSRAVLADRDGYVAVIRSYLDESGIHKEAPVVVVAGYFGRPKVWKAFTHDWRRVLKPRGLEVFHSSDAQALKGEFEDWTEEDRDEVVKKLLPIIKRHEIIGMAIGFVMRDFDEAMGRENWPKEYLGSPYGTCFQWLITSVLMEAALDRVREPVAFFHEHNDFEGEARKAYNWAKENRDYNEILAGLAFSDKKRYVPLQAADILAYEVGKRLNNPSGNRRPFKILTDPPRRPKIKFYNKSNMKTLVEAVERARWQKILSGGRERWGRV